MMLIIDNSKEEKIVIKASKKLNEQIYNKFFEHSEFIVDLWLQESIKKQKLNLYIINKDIASYTIRKKLEEVVSPILLSIEKNETIKKIYGFREEHSNILSKLYYDRSLELRKTNIEFII